MSGSKHASTDTGPACVDLTCRNCQKTFLRRAPGTSHRNHCPKCLWSVHLDGRKPGDRAAACGGLMEPLAVAARTDGEWSIVHRCRSCGLVRLNRIAGDDDEVALLALALRPLSRPAFPLDSLNASTRSGRDDPR